VPTNWIDNTNLCVAADQITSEVEQEETEIEKKGNRSFPKAQIIFTEKANFRKPVFFSLYFILFYYK
jgi:hypothetical protein